MGGIRDDIRQAFSKGNSAGVQLILINLFVFIGLAAIRFILSLAPETKPLVASVNDNFLLSTDLATLITHPWVLLTYGFTNRTILNLLFNLITLFWFGTLIHDFVGNRKLINIYFLGYIFSGLLYVLIFHITVVSKTPLPLIETISGANAGVYALMFAAITLLPDYEFFLFRRFYLKIKYLALLFLGLSFLEPSFGLINLGGAFLGYLYIKLLRVGVDLGSPIEGFQEWLSGLRNPKSKKKPQLRQFSHSTVGKASNFHSHRDEHDYLPDQEEIDALLDKISISGYESLTKLEKERLYLASKNQKL